MAETEAKRPDSLIRETARLAESAGKITVVLTGICFLVGLIITNLYLLRWGIVDFSIVKIKYILTGAVFLVVNGLLYLFLWSTIDVFQKMFRRNLGSILTAVVFGLLRLIGVVLLSFALGVFLIVWLINKDYSPFSLFYTVEWQDLWPFLALCPTLLLTHALFATSIRKRQRFARLEVTIFGLILPLAWLFNLTLFAHELYPSINPQFGGGRPLKATFLLDGKLNKSLPAGLRIPDTPALAEWALVHERENEYIAAAFNDSSRTINIMTLPKALTHGFFLDEKRLYESTTESIKAGAIYTAGPGTWRILLKMDEVGFSIADMSRASQLLSNDITNFLLVRRRLESAILQKENLSNVMEQLVISNPEWKTMAQYILAYLIEAKILDSTSTEM
jgi:hypothetical protein